MSVARVTVSELGRHVALFSSQIARWCTVYTQRPLWGIQLILHESSDTNASAFAQYTRFSLQAARGCFALLK